MYQTRALGPPFVESASVKGRAMPNGQPEIEWNDELVVDLDEAERVQGKLKDLNVPSTRHGESAALRLARLTLDLADPRLPEGPHGPSSDPLDQVIYHVRQAFKAEFDDWTPDIGKNRLVGSVVGSPYTGGAAGIPAPQTAGAPARAARGAVLSGQPMQAGESLPERKEPGHSQVSVGILDTRLFPHPDLAGRYLASHGTFVSKSQAAAARPAGDPSRVTLSHATFIAGVVLDWAPEANLVIGHVLDTHAETASSWEVAVKMAAFAAKGVAVLNVSFGAATGDDEPPLVLSRAVRALREHGVVVVAAAGNGGPQAKRIWPAALASVVSVGAGKPVGGGAFESATFSPLGTWVDLQAPGEDVYSTYEADEYASWRGTSFAAAAVSGAIAGITATGVGPQEVVDWLKTPPPARNHPRIRAVVNNIGP